MRPRIPGPLFMVEGRARSRGGRGQEEALHGAGEDAPGQATANYLRPPRGSSTHGPTTCMRSAWCVLWPTQGPWLATHRRRWELGSGSEREANQAGRSRAGALRRASENSPLLI
jgi:hypothetical protein